MPKHKPTILSFEFELAKYRAEAFQAGWRCYQIQECHRHGHDGGTWSPVQESARQNALRAGFHLALWETERSKRAKAAEQGPNEEGPGR